MIPPVGRLELVSDGVLLLFCFIKSNKMMVLGKKIRRRSDIEEATAVSTWVF